MTHRCAKAAQGAWGSAAMGASRSWEKRALQRREMHTMLLY
jgi:hypothetical protein